MLLNGYGKLKYQVPILRMEYTKQSYDNILKAYAESSSSSLQVLARTKLFVDKYKGSKEMK